MIFVTVGTHEQPFDRLVEYIDDLKGNGVIDEDVIMQTGYCTYIPKHCKWKKLLSYSDMQKYIEEARIVITHGGPSSFIMTLQGGKVPVVVPRQSRFGEHVNDHQIGFIKVLAERQGNIIAVEDIDALQDIILNYEKIVKNMSTNIESNNAAFNRRLQLVTDELMTERNRRLFNSS